MSGLIERALNAETEAQARRDAFYRECLDELIPGAEAELKRLLGTDLPRHEWSLAGVTTWARTELDGLTFIYRQRAFGKYEIVWERPSDRELLSFDDLQTLGRLLRLAGYAISSASQETQQ